MKYYQCRKCGNVMVLLEDSGVIPVCCGSTMEELIPQSTDGPKEKHVPVVERKDNCITVQVGELLHPMEDSHFIKWIVLETDKNKYLRTLKPGDEPRTKFFILENEVPKTVYEYCNIHSLWVKDI